MANPKNPILKAQSVSFDATLFTVEQQNPREFFPDVSFGRQIATMIHSPTLNKVLHFGGSQYQLITNEQLFMPIYERLHDMFGSSGFRMQCWNEDDRRFSVQFILLDKTIQVADKDMVNAMIEVQNSYDGTLRHSIGLSFYRQICSNGMMGWKKEVPDDQAKHFSSYVPNLDRILQKLDHLDHQLRQFRVLTERQVSSKEIDGIAEALRGHTAYSFPKRLIQQGIDSIGTEADIANVGKNAWMVYNSFNRILNHNDKVGLAMDVIEKIDRKVITTLAHELNLELAMN